MPFLDSLPKTFSQAALPRELAAQAVTVRIRWFGLIVGYLLVNLEGIASNRPVLNAILALGTLYAVLDTYFHLRQQAFLSKWPLFISVMEATFIGLLCYFDQGLSSSFRFYYLLSLLVCAIRYQPSTTYTTCGLHIISYLTLAALSFPLQREQVTATILMPVLMGWVTWACVSFAGLLKYAGQRLAELNDQLQQNQLLLEDRIAERTRELQESQALLVQHEKQAAFGLLAAGIAHEVGNPLAAISSLVQLLNRREQDEYTRERLHMVDDQLRRIQRTLRELVDFSRPATKAVSACDVHAVIDAALNIAKYYKRRKGKQIVTNYCTGTPPFRIVRDQLVQVFLNLILNAMDATPEEGLIKIETEYSDGWLKIDIIDNGSGIRPEDQEKIFQPYFTTKPTGTGLGLFVCQRIVQHEMGGRFELTESTSAGTTFSVWLPEHSQFDSEPIPLPVQMPLVSGN